MTDLKQALEEVYRDCQNLGWDGYGAPPVTLKTLIKAKEFLAALPINRTKNLEFSAEPSGDISFDWWDRANCQIGLGIDALGRITYASRFDSARVRGTEIFNITEGIPPQITMILDRFYSKDGV